MDKNVDAEKIVNQAPIKPFMMSRFNNPAILGWHWSTIGKFPGLLFAIELVGIVAMIDFVTGYEVRLAMLYIVPIGLATWTGGLRSGVVVSILAVSCWFISFQSQNIYSDKIFYYWEGAILTITFLAFVILLTRLRDALARADERFLRVLEGSYAGIYVVNDDTGEILYANRHLSRLINDDPAFMRAADFEDHFISVTTSLEQTQTHRQIGATNFISEEARDERNGRWYLIQSGSIPWENNQRATLKMIMDISEQKQSQLLKRQHQEILHHTAHLTALAEIASTIAHEINQPLMAISSYNDACLRLLSKEKYDVTELMNALEKSRTQAIRAGQIINRTRSLIRRRSFTPSPGSINGILRDAIQSLELELQDASTKTELKIDESLPEIVFDHTLIAQVIINFVQNAIDAMQSTEISRRTISITSAIKNNNEILIAVSDNGPGIPKEVADMLYTPFFTTKPKGLGLGLCICRSVIEAHAGYLSHQSNADGGTSFFFTLPIDTGN